MLNTKQLQCIKMMIETKLTQKEIAKKIEISEVSISNWKKDEEFKNEYKRYIEESIGYNARKALQTMFNLLKSKNDQVKYLAARDILDRSGYSVSKADISSDNTLNIKINYGE